MPRSVFSLWVGGQPSALALASMASFAALGHPYTLYAYDSDVDLPVGVTLADAGEVVPRRKVAYLLERRAYAMVANLFRYTRLRHGGLWADTDVIALRTFDFPEGDLVFAWEDAEFLNTAVLGAPAGHPLVAELHRRATSFRASYSVAETAHAGGGRLRRARGILRHGRTFSHAEVPWGTFGPRLLTRVAQEQGFTVAARGPGAFYPIHYCDLDVMLVPGRAGEAVITPATYAVHLWNEALRREGVVEPPPGSLLERLLIGASRRSVERVG